MRPAGASERLTQIPGRTGKAKEAAAKQVKSLLKPLLEQGHLNKEQFKEAARAATHGLYRQGMTDKHNAVQLLGEVLCKMDLPDAARFVLLAE